MANTVRPTKKQRELLNYIEQFIGEHGYSPSYREIMTGLNYTSVATVALHINNLIKRGHLRKRDHSARSLEVTAPSETPAKAVAGDDVKPGDEKWLVDRVEYFFQRAETAEEVSQDHVDQLFVLIGALKVLELDGAAQSFMPRLNDLKQKVVKESE
jgi:SOS-response transcriptional repressor LexA